MEGFNKRHQMLWRVGWLKKRGRKAGKDNKAKFIFLLSGESNAFLAVSKWNVFVDLPGKLFTD